MSFVMRTHCAQSGAPEPAGAQSSKRRPLGRNPAEQAGLAFSCRRIQCAFAALGTALLAACAKTPEPPAPRPVATTERTTEAGAVVGTTAENGALVWRAIPYAAPPVGALRWKAPRPPLAWKGVREAVAAGPRCPQLTNRLNRAEGKKPGALMGSEDCLTLDVYAPKDAAAPSALPVMVWIHGGGNVWGGSDQYDAARLAENGRVVVVAVQYRLNVLGYFSHPLLRAGAETDEDRTANFGLLDLVAALRWTRDNVGAFGGDPARVTIFGESAGGQNVGALLVAPQARGLFHRAIIQSGGFDTTPQADAEGAKAAGETLPNTAHDVAVALHASSAEDLRAAPLAALYAALKLDASDYLVAPTLIEDGVVVPEGGLRPVLAQPGGAAAVPVLTGTNKDEMKLFQLVDDRLTKRRFGVLLSPRDPALYAANAEYLSRIWRLRAVDDPARMLTAAGNPDVFAYRFDWDDAGAFFGGDMGALLGACHAMEIPFVFGRFRLFGDLDRVVFAKKTEADRRALSDEMQAFWSAFAREGAPGAAWPRWSDNGGTLMRLDTKAGGGSSPFADAETMARIVADMKKDPRLDEARRCAIAEGSAEFNHEIARTLTAELGCR